MTQFGVTPRTAGSKFFPPVQPIVRAHIPTVEELEERDREIRRQRAIASQQRTRAWRRKERQRKEEERLAGAEARRRVKIEELEERLSRTPLCSARKVIDHVAEETGYSVEELIGASRKGLYLAQAKHYAYWLCRKKTGLSLSQIARNFGRKHHTTIMHGIRAHQARVDAGEVMPWEREA